MVGLPRLFGFTASLAGTLGQLGVIAATVPAWPECLWSACRYGGDPWPAQISIGWEPYIDNPGIGMEPSRERRCPGPQAEGALFRIDYSPLPPAFDAHAYPDGDVLACVRLRSDGSVEAVRILAGTGGARLDSRLRHAVRRQWRFRPVEPGEGGRTWQRVRLSSGFPGEPPPLPL